VHSPPLRDHPDDIPVMAQHFLSRCAERLNREVEGFSEEAMEALLRYPWPGNVRELENMIERLAVLCRAKVIELRDLPEPVRQAMRKTQLRGAPGSLQEMERQRIVEALEEAGGNKKLAARRLGIHRSTLYAKLRRFELLDERQPGNGNGNGRDRQQDVSDPATLVPTS
jgi:two-component system response regulator HydG